MALVSKARKCRHRGIYLLGETPHTNVTDSRGLWLQSGEHFGTILQFGLGRREVAGGHGVAEARPRVGSVTKRLIGRLPAPAEGDHRTASEAESVARGVEDFEITLDADGTVIENRDFSRHLRDGSTGRERKKIRETRFVLSAFIGVHRRPIKC